MKVINDLHVAEFSDHFSVFILLNIYIPQIRQDHSPPGKTFFTCIIFLLVLWQQICIFSSFLQILNFRVPQGLVGGLPFAIYTHCLDELVHSMALNAIKMLVISKTICSVQNLLPLSSALVLTTTRSLHLDV